MKRYWDGGGGGGEESWGRGNGGSWWRGNGAGSQKVRRKESKQISAFDFFKNDPFLERYWEGAEGGMGRELGKGEGGAGGGETGLDPRR